MKTATISNSKIEVFFSFMLFIFHVIEYFCGVTWKPCIYVFLLLGEILHILCSFFFAFQSLSCLCSFSFECNFSFMPCVPFFFGCNFFHVLSSFSFGCNFLFKNVLCSFFIGCNFLFLSCVPFSLGAIFCLCLLFLFHWM